VKVAFDGAPLAHGHITGVGRSFLTTLRAWRQLATADAVLLLPDGAEDPGLPGIEVLQAPRGGVRRQRLLPSLLRQAGADLLHSPVASVPLRAKCPVIATVHDLPWRAPVPVDGAGAWRRLVTRRCLKRADAVLVPSQFTLRCIWESEGGPATEKARVVPHGVVFPERPARAADLTGPFLCLGDDRPRKNRARIAAAHARAQRRCPGLPDLRFVGPPDAYVSETEKLAVLRTSRALVHGSLFEGFGLPVLEAMAHGVPVLCSAVASLPEVGGNAALYFDPFEVDRIADAMVAVHENGMLRAEMRSAGLLRAVEFPPERTARAWLEVHLELCP
jgi:glycosyltransferase involved in cell wall biosynthesis